MTCLVGLVHEGSVWIGADRLSNDGCVGTMIATSKVQRHPEMLLASSGEPRVGQLLAYAFIPPLRHAETTSDIQYLVRQWVPSLRATLDTYGVPVEEDKGGNTRWAILLGYRGHLYEIYDDFQVTESLCGWSAAGCSYKAALGALHATYGRVEDPDLRVVLALQAAEQVDIHVRGPFDIERLEPPTEAT